MKIDTAEIKGRVSVHDLMQQDGHKLVMMGGLFKCRCPFHNEKTPSCVVYADHFHCFGCGARGDVISYVMLRDGINFQSALEKLGGSGASTFRQTWSAPVARETQPLAGAVDVMTKWREETDYDDLEAFAVAIGVSAWSLMALGCAWAAPHGAWAFPMRDSRGDVVGIRLRSNGGKKWAVAGSKEGLFHGAIQIGRQIVICEGPTDAAAGLTLDLNIVGRPSCRGAVQELVRLVTRLDVREVLIISDNDGPGLAGSERLQAHLPVPYREIVLPCKDLREFLTLGGTKQLLESMSKNQLPKWRPAK